MEHEAKMRSLAEIQEAITLAWWEKSDHPKIDFLLSGLTLEDRWALTDALYKEWAKDRQRLSLMELAWYVHP